MYKIQHGDQVEKCHLLYLLFCFFDFFFSQQFLNFIDGFPWICSHISSKMKMMKLFLRQNYYLTVNTFILYQC